ASAHRPKRDDRPHGMRPAPWRYLRWPDQMAQGQGQGRHGRRRIVILGGGFAGVGGAQRARHSHAEVVLVDRHDYHTFQPLLYQCATGLLEPTAVGHSLRDLVEGQGTATIHEAPVTAIELDDKVVRFEGLAPITYDYLILALG